MSPGAPAARPRPRTVAGAGGLDARLLAKVLELLRDALQLFGEAVMNRGWQ